jgi:tetratricopeptide (TPR) repeat protein
MAFPPRGGEAYLPIIQSGPVDRINASLFVYRGRFEIPLLSALSHIDRSEVLIRYKRFDEAIRDAQVAVGLAPLDPRMHLALGLAYGAAGRNDEAKREFAEAIQNVQGNPLFRNIELRARRELSKLNGS